MRRLMSLRGLGLTFELSDALGAVHMDRTAQLFDLPGESLLQRDAIVRLASVRFDECSTVFDQRHRAIFYRCWPDAMVHHA